MFSRELKNLPGIAEDLPAADKRAVADKGDALSRNTVIDLIRHI
jgi:hypothetical protein